MSDKALEIKLGHQRGDFTLSLDCKLPAHGITAIFGPSGAGKSTLLRLIAGLEPTKGTIRLFGEALSSLPSHRRSVAYMAQGPSLFDHLSVQGNLDFAEKRCPDKSAYSLGDVITQFELGSLLTRKPATLSGGEARRAALARALLSRPRLLLLDEPLTGLDRSRKAALMPFLQKLPKAFGVPIIFVTHDIEELAYLADTVALLEAGQLTAHGPASTIIGDLDTHPLTGRYAASSLLEGQVTGHNKALHMTQISLGENQLSVPGDRPLGTCRLRIRARDISLALSAPEGLSIRNALPCKVTGITEDTKGPYAQVALRLKDGQTLRARITRAALSDMALTPGQSIFALIKAASFDGPLS